MSTPSLRSRLTPIAASHPAARRYLRARRNVLPRDDQLIATSGLWAHQQLIRLGGSIEVFLWCRGDIVTDSMAAVVDRLVTRAAASYEISERTLARLQPEARAPGLLSVVRIPAWEPEGVLSRDARVVLVADGIEYAGNLGALLRTVDASGADALVVTNPVARLTHPTVFSASRGTVLTTPTLQFESVGEARRVLEAAGFAIIVADPEAAVDYREVRYDGQRIAIVVGSEGSGVCAEWRVAAAQRVSISMRGRADSLNVATAAAVLLFGRAPDPRSVPSATLTSSLPGGPGVGV